MSVCVAELMTLAALVMAQADPASPSYTQVDYPWVSVVLSLQDEPPTDPALQDPDAKEDAPQDPDPDEDVPKDPAAQDDPGQEPGDEPPPMDEVVEGDETPFIDFDLLEGAARLSFVSYGGEYDADAEPGFGVSFRAPIPSLSLKDEGEWSGDVNVDEAFKGYFSAYAELIISSLDRDISPLSTNSGTTFFLGLGLDYTFHRSPDWVILARAGFQYGKFGGVSDVDDGIAFTLGATAGINVSEQLWVTFTPEVALGDGENIIFNHLGLLYKF